MIHQVDYVKTNEFETTGLAHLQPMNIVLSDPDPLVRRGIRCMLEGEYVAHVVRESGCIITLENLLSSQVADIIFIDIHLIAADDFHMFTVLKGKYEACRFIAMGQSADVRLAMEALRAGVDGYLPKEGSVSELQSTLRRIVSGANALLPNVAEMLFDNVIASNRRLSFRSEVAPLSPREQQVLECLTEGMCNKEIAVALDVTVRTVKAHVSNVLRKMGVSDRTQAVVKALSAGDNVIK